MHFLCECLVLNGHLCVRTHMVYMEAWYKICQILPHKDCNMATIPCNTDAIFSSCGEKFS